MPHTHSCDCGEVIEVLDTNKAQCPQCLNDEKVYCHRHHPDESQRVTDPPQVKMTVSVAELSNKG